MKTLYILLIIFTISCTRAKKVEIDYSTKRHQELKKIAKVVLGSSIYQHAEETEGQQWTSYIPPDPWKIYENLEKPHDPKGAKMGFLLF